MIHTVRVGSKRDDDDGVHFHSIMDLEPLNLFKKRCLMTNRFFNDQNDFRDVFENIFLILIKVNDKSKKQLSWGERRKDRRGLTVK